MADINNNNAPFQDDDSLSISFSDILENIIYYRLVFSIIAGVIFGMAVVYALLAKMVF